MLFIGSNVATSGSSNSVLCPMNPNSSCRPTSNMATNYAHRQCMTPMYTNKMFSTEVFCKCFLQTLVSASVLCEHFLRMLSANVSYRPLLRMLSAKFICEHVLRTFSTTVKVSARGICKCYLRVLSTSVFYECYLRMLFANFFCEHVLRTFSTNVICECCLRIFSASMFCKRFLRMWSAKIFGSVFCERILQNVVHPNKMFFTKCRLTNSECILSQKLLPTTKCLYTSSSCREYILLASSNKSEAAMFFSSQIGLCALLQQVGY